MSEKRPRPFLLLAYEHELRPPPKRVIGTPLTFAQSRALTKLIATLAAAMDPAYGPRLDALDDEMAPSNGGKAGGA